MALPAFAMPAPFRDQLKVDTDKRRLFGTIIEPWQRADFEALDPAWLQAVGYQGFDPSACRRLWCERPRGHSKTSDIAVSILWALTCSRRKINGVCAASDRDQAALIIAAMERLIDANPVSQLKVQAGKVLNTRTGSACEIISSDAGSSYGLLPDYVIADEICHWPERGEQLWVSLMSSAAKKKTCLVLCITNAGFTDSWQGKLRERIRNDPAWRFSRLEGPRASWITADTLAEQQRLLPELSFKRLWLNEWTSGTGDALRSDDINSALTLEGPLQPSPKYRFAAGLDLGLKRDASALVIVGSSSTTTELVPREDAPKDWRQRVYADVGLRKAKPEFDEVIHEGTGRVALGEVRVWRPQDERVSIDAIEKSILDLHKAYRLDALAIDPWQGMHLAERLRNEGMNVIEAHFSAVNLKAMATAVLESFSEKRIDLWRHEDLLADLRSLRIQETANTFRLSPVRDSRGHGDTATALALALFAAQRIPAYVRPFVGSVVYD